MTRLLMLLGALALVVAACGDSSAPTTTIPTTVAPPGTTTTTLPPPTTAAPTTTAATTSVPPTTAPATTVAPTTTAASTTTAAPTTTVLAGQPFDTYVPTPAEGPVVGVIGVRFDDTLNVRSGPGTSFDVVGVLAPTAQAITGTGDGWQLPSGAVWWRIEAGTVSGWTSSSFLSRFDGTDDVTANVVAQLGGIPSAATMVALGTLVAGAMVDADVGSDVVQVTPAVVGDVGEVAFDVIGAADDSVQGVRLVIFGQPDGEGFSLMAVEATALCLRGLADGICV